MNKPTYPREGTKLSIILDILLRAHGQPVGVNILMIKAHATAVHSGVSDLRLKHGWDIKNQMKRVRINGVTEIHSEYWIPLDKAA